MIRNILIVLLLCGISGCGRRGALVSPDALVPAAVADLESVQRGESVQLSWGYSSRLQSATGLDKLAYFTVYRRERSPANLTCRECPDSWQILKKLDLQSSEEYARQGKSFILIDRSVTVGTIYEYLVTASSLSGAESSRTAITERFLRLPPSPPELKVSASAIDLSIECISGTVPSDAQITGCAIFRSISGNPLPLVPNFVIPPGTIYRDKNLDPAVSFDYAAAIEVRSNGDKVQGVLSEKVRAKLSEPE